jgi:hypothetical protein
VSHADLRPHRLLVCFTGQVVFLASDDSNYITGAELFAGDGFAQVQADLKATYDNDHHLLGNAGAGGPGRSTGPRHWGEHAAPRAHGEW